MLSADTQTNWVPRVLGSMMVRPGLEFVGQTYDDAECRLVPFVFNSSDKALLEVSTGGLRVWVDDALVERTASTAAVSNGNFNFDISGWTDADEAGTTSYWISGLGLVGTRYAQARSYQQVTAPAGTLGLSVHVTQGRPLFRVGSSANGDDYFAEAELRDGHYSFEITSTGNFFIQFAANTDYTSIVSSVQVESAGAMRVPTTWAAADLGNLRWDQSNDVVFTACSSYAQKRIERYDAHSWGVVSYLANDGPFRTLNQSAKRLTPTALTGDITVTCDQSFFVPDHLGALFEITSIGQDVTFSPTGGDQNSASIRVSGVDDARKFQYLVSTADSSCPIYIQRSIGEEGSWQTITALKISSSKDSTYDDELDNQIVFYRMYTPSTFSGSAEGELTYSGGGIIGRFRINDVVDSQTVDGYVVQALGSTSASELWAEGDWSTLRGFPTAVALHEGRVFWGGKSKLWGSISDAFESFDADSSGDAGPINLNVAAGANDTIRWMVSLTRLIIGTPLQELQAKTSSLEEPLTPTNFALRDISTQGSAAVQAVKIDQRCLFVQKGQVRVFEVAMKDTAFDYESIDKTTLVPEIGEPMLVRAAVQRQPDTRVHFVRSDGTVAMLLSDPAENVLCWLDIATSGTIEEVAVLPGDVEDQVYYVVRREVGGSTKRFIERWALESQAQGDADCRVADCHVVQTSTRTDTIVGLDHLEGESVVVWGSGTDLGSHTVSGGQITVSSCSTQFCAGLPYSAMFVGAKLVDPQRPFGGLTERKRGHHVGIVAQNMHSLGLQVGPSTSRLQMLPKMERSAVVSSTYVWDRYDNDPIIFPGKWDTDARLCLYGHAPQPATILGAIFLAERASS